MAGQMECVDFIGLLPPEIVEKIVSLLDVDSFISCTTVCKKWKSIISDEPHMWKIACQKLGLRVEKAKSTQEVVDYKTILLRMRNRLEKMEDGYEFTEIDTFNSKTSALSRVPRVTCMYYHNGIVAIAGHLAICLWKLDPHLELLLRIDMQISSHATCIQFDESFIVAGTYVGKLMTWTLPTARKLYQKRQIPSLQVPISAVMFNKELDLVVAAFVKSWITIYCLTSGEVLVPQFDVDQTNRMWHTQLHLFVNPGVELSEGCDYLLICVSSDSYCPLNFNSKQVSSTLTHCPFQKLDMDDSPIEDLITTIHVSNSHIYFMCSLHTTWTSSLCTMNLRNGDFEYVHCFKDYFDEILGAGEKYLCMLARERSPISPISQKMKYMVIIDVSSNEEVARLDIPEYFSKEFIVHKCLGDTSWLDGFNGFNDKDTLFVSGSNTLNIHVVKWLT